MMLLSKTKFILMTPLLVALLLPGSAMARNGADDSGSDDRGGRRSSGDGSSNRSGNSAANLRFKTRLRDAPGVVTEAFGVASRRLEGKRGKREERFDASVKIPIPSMNPAVVDEAAARALDVRLILTRGGTAYAHCTLPLGRIETEIHTSDDSPSVVRAHYRIDLRRREKKNRMRFELRRGVCDTNLNLDGVQSGVPQALKGDSLSVTLGSDLSAPALLVGQF